jgi:predicted Zn-dependent peptidase
MLNRTLAPAAYPIELIKFPHVTSTSLSNGIEIQSLSLGEQAVFKLEFTVQAGASAAEKAGIASLTSSLMKRGTQQRDATAIHKFKPTLTMLPLSYMALVSIYNHYYLMCLKSFKRLLSPQKNSRKKSQ